MALPDRGSLIWLLFSPQAGSEQAGRRPGIVLTPVGYHQRSRLAIVCPITSRERGWPMEVKLPSAADHRCRPGDHIRSVDREARKMEVVGQAPQQVLDEIDARLAPLLNL